MMMKRRTHARHERRREDANEKILKVLIDQVTEAYQALPCHETIRALYLMREALTALRMRSARRVNAACPAPVG